MCGIVGISSKFPILDKPLLTAMRDALIHRGPDNEGSWWSLDSCVGLAHRRLAIIDLSPGGNQPMSDRTGALHIVFNGEIYNYRDLRAELCQRGHQFRSQSDTEVILESYREWDTDCLGHLNGAFAFAIYDEKTDSLFLARDRAGEKPLFYSQTADRFWFGSELKALFADATFPRKIDREALEFYLAYGHVPSQHCILSGVRKLPAAHAMKLCRQTNELKVWRYWQLPDQSDAVRDPAELEEELHRLLDDAVRRQLIADVPVGILLSGGVDSSVITAIAASISPDNLRTFTVTFPGHKSYDEGPFARTVADHFHTRHTELAAKPATVDVLPLLARQYDEPLADSSLVPTYMVSKLVREHCTVALGGDGGDELFGGYPSYNWIFTHAAVRRYLPRMFRSAISAFATKLLPVGLKGRAHLIGMNAGLPEALAYFNLLYDDTTRRRLVPALRERPLNDISRPELSKSLQCRPERGIPAMAMSLDFQTYLQDDILVKVDRASMLNSLEVRAPFLDHRVIEFAFGSVPNSLRADPSERKILLRRLASRVLPKHLNLRRKQGFVLPLRQWLKEDWGRYMRDVLSSSDSPFDSVEVGRLWDGQTRGLHNTERLFALTMFELWRQAYKVAF